MTTQPCVIFFPVSNQLSGGCERPPGAAGSEGELLAMVWGGQRRRSGWGPHTELPLFL